MNPQQTKDTKEGSGTMQEIHDLRELSLEDLAVLGLGHVAYLRPVKLDGHRVWAVFAANGQQVAVMPSYEAAWSALLQNDLELASLH